MVDLAGALLGGVFIAVVCVMYGVFVGVCWTPFLLVRRFRLLFDALPLDDWRVSYALAIPVPAVLWGFLFGAVLSLSGDLRPPSKASPLYLGGVDGIVVATLVSIVVWPTLLVSVLPSSGYDWDPADYSPTTVVLVVVALVWYLLFLVGPAYVFSVFAGFGDAFAGT